MTNLIEEITEARAYEHGYSLLSDLMQDAIKVEKGMTGGLAPTPWYEVFIDDGSVMVQAHELKGGSWSVTLELYDTEGDEVEAPHAFEVVLHVFSKEIEDIKNFMQWADKEGVEV